MVNNKKKRTPSKVSKKGNNKGFLTTLEMAEYLKNRISSKKPIQPFLMLGRNMYVLIPQ